MMSKTAMQKRPITVPVWGGCDVLLGGGGLGPPNPSLVTSLITTSQKCELKVKQTSSKNMDCSLFWLQMIMQHLLGQFVHFCVHHKSSRYVLHIIK